jgi:hypothetical protein
VNVNLATAFQHDEILWQLLSPRRREYPAQLFESEGKYAGTRLA